MTDGTKVQKINQKPLPALSPEAVLHVLCALSIVYHVAMPYFPFVTSMRKDESLRCGLRRGFSLIRHFRRSGRRGCRGLLAARENAKRDQQHPKDCCEHLAIHKAPPFAKFTQQAVRASHYSR